MAIELIKVRAYIEVGNLQVGTPPLGFTNHIMSFNVDKSRGQISTFSASLKVSRSEISGGLVDNAEIRIWAGTIDNYLNNKIFTGVVRTATITPNRDDPEFVILNLSGNDFLGRLNGKKYTRRCRSTKGTWVSIDSISRPGLRAGKFAYVPSEQSLDVFGGEELKNDPLTVTRTQTVPSNIDTLKHDQNEKEVVIQVQEAEVQ